MTRKPKLNLHHIRVKSFLTDEAEKVKGGFNTLRAEATDCCSARCTLALRTNCC